MNCCSVFLFSLFLFTSSAMGQEDVVKKLLNSEIHVVIKQTGEENCFVNSQAIRISAERALKELCNLNIIDNPDSTNSRMYITMDWGQFRMTTSQQDISICAAGVMYDIGKRELMSEYQPQQNYPDGKIVVHSILSWVANVGHTMESRSRSEVQGIVETNARATAEAACVIE